MKYVNSSLAGNLLMKVLSSIKPVLFEQLPHEDKAGNFIDQMYKDDEGRFLTSYIFAETDDIVEKIRMDILSFIYLHKKLFCRPVPKIWVERFFVHEMYWDTFWQVLLMAVIKKQNSQEETDSGHFASRFLIKDSPSNKYLFQSKYFEDASTIVFGRGLRRFIILSDYLRVFLFYIAITFHCLAKAIYSFRFTRRPAPYRDRVAVEYVWGHDLNTISDIYWYQNIDLPSSQLLFYFSRPDRPLTVGLKRNLQENGFDFVSLIDFFGGRANAKWAPGSMKYIYDINCITNLLLILLCNRYYLKDISIAWCVLKGIKLVYKVNYWKSFFKDFNSKINMSHSGDTGSVHVTQSLAMHLCDGINVRTNYSYTSLTYSYHAREFHTYFRWGSQMGCDTDERLYNYINVITGYPFDYLFKAKNDILPNRTSIQKQQFTIAIFDTTISNDYRKIFLQAFIKVAVECDIHVIFKPKKNLEIGIQEFPDYKEGFKKGNLTILTKDDRPYQVSANANISICLGMNTAGIEVCLDGGRCLYWIPDNYRCPQLASEESSKLIFYDLEELLKLVKSLASGKRSIDGIGDHSKFISQIDPWRDHKASKRIGEYLIKYLGSLKIVPSANEALEHANHSYMAQWGNDKVEKCLLE